MPGDAELLATAVEGIAHLNKRYGPAAGGGSRFVLFHRRRVWNESELLDGMGTEARQAA